MISRTFYWIGKRREKETIRMCIELANKVRDAVNAMYELVNAYVNNDFNKLNDIYNKVFIAEREADNIKSKIIRSLAEGVFHPIDREEIAKLTLAIDDVAAGAKVASRSIVSDFSRYTPYGIGSSNSSSSSSRGDHIVEDQQEQFLQFLIHQQVEPLQQQ